jgi:hypothetical protein
MQTRDLRLLKTLKTATVASTPLAIWGSKPKPSKFLNSLEFSALR